MENELILTLDKISESLKRLDLSVKSINRLTGELIKLNDSSIVLSNTTSQLDSNNILLFFSAFDKVMAPIDSIANLNSALEGLQGLGKMLSDSGASISKFFKESEMGASIASSSTGLFSSALTFLAQNPVVAVIGGLALLVGAVAVLNSSFGNQNEELQKLSEKSNELTEKSIKLKDAQSQLNESASNSMTSQLGKYEVIKQYANELILLGQGNVNEIANAQGKVDELNSYYGETVVQIENGKLAWVGETDEIKKNLEAMKLRAMIAANEEAYGNALLTNGEIVNNLTEAETNLADANSRINEEIQKYIDQGLTYDEAVTKAYTNNSELAKTIGDCTQGYWDSCAAMAENQLSLDKQAALEIQSQAALDGSNVSVEKLVTSYVALTGEYDSQLGKGNEVSASWGTLSQKLNDYDAVLNGHGDKFKQMTDKEKNNAEESKNVVIGLMAEKAVNSAQTYSDMVYSMGSAYEKMTEKEKTELAKQYNLRVQNNSSEGAEMLRQYGVLSSYLEKNHIDANSKKAKQYASSLRLAQEKGSSEGQKYLSSISEQMDKEENIPKLDINDEQALKNVDTLQTKINNLKGTSVNVSFKASTKGFKLSSGETISISTYAMGGFPDTGELFVAREAGPELVGRINGKTAVANNDQIVSGISSGVYNAVRSAMSGNGGNGNMNIHATFVMDGDVVGKQVIKYHNGVVKRTGTTPLMI